MDRGRQWFTTEQFLKVVLEDREGLASSLIHNADGDSAYGSRTVKRVVQRSLRYPPVTMILEGKVHDAETVRAVRGSDGLS